MRKTVEEGEKANHQNAGRDFHLRFLHDERSEYGDRKQNRHFDARQGHSGGSDHPADCHNADESQWNQPDRASALLRRPPSHSNHHNQMVPAVEGMIETVIPAVDGQA